MLFETYVHGQSGGADGHAQMFDFVVGEDVDDASGDGELHAAKVLAGYFGLVPVHHAHLYGVEGNTLLGWIVEGDFFNEH